MRIAAFEAGLASVSIRLRLKQDPVIYRPASRDDNRAIIIPGLA
jgi:hypothetical protein